MNKRSKLILVSVFVAILVTLASSTALPSWVISTIDASPGGMNMIASPGAGSGSAG